MRLKKDKNSWSAGGVIHKNNRHDKSTQEIGKRKSKKDTRRWCRGKEGVRHDLVWRDAKKLQAYSDITRTRNSMELACTICSKLFEIDHFFRSRKLDHEEELKKLKEKLYGRVA